MRSLPVGDHALLVEVDDARAAAATARLVHEWSGVQDGLSAPRDVVPAAQTVLLDGLTGPDQVAAWRERLAVVDPANLPQVATVPGRDVTIDTSYTGADLDAVATAWGCSPEAVVERHQRTEFLVAFCGFAPGFAYCVPAEPLPEVPRRDVPRERVPLGSVALAGQYCGIYPREMPGGWQLVGHTSAVLFDPDRDQPALLVPGTTVRFRAVR